MITLKNNDKETKRLLLKYLNDKDIIIKELSFQNDIREVERDNYLIPKYEYTGTQNLYIKIVNKKIIKK